MFELKIEAYMHNWNRQTSTVAPLRAEVAKAEYLDARRSDTFCTLSGLDLRSLLTWGAQIRHAWKQKPAQKILLGSAADTPV